MLLTFVHKLNQTILSLTTYNAKQKKNLYTAHKAKGILIVAQVIIGELVLLILTVPHSLILDQQEAANGSYQFKVKKSGFIWLTLILISVVLIPILLWYFFIS